MRWRVLALVSLGVNVVLVLLGLGWGSLRSASSEKAARSAAFAAEASTRTNLVLRRMAFSWKELESADYPTYIANLRDVGCPEQTVRDIIIADVNALYARRRSTEIQTPEQQWWRGEPDTNLAQVASSKLKALDEERRNLLTSLLGPSWESGDVISLPRPTRQGIVLDGPVLGALPAELKQALLEANFRAEDRMAAYLEAQKRDGKTPDPLEVARLKRQARDELARILPPAQLEEYLLRYSDSASGLRAELGQLKFFDDSPDEFRAIFRARDAYDQQLALLVGDDANTVAQRKSLESARDNAIRVALGPQRYEEYLRLHDPAYRDAYAAAIQAGVPEAARSIYAINMIAAAEQNRIAADASLTASQKAIELKKLELDQLKANTAASGQDLPPEPPPIPVINPRKTYTMRPGDTAAVVSIIYGVPLSAIRDANPNVDINRLKPGDSLNIPPSPIPQAPRF
jgi:LysM repeat protein